MKKLTRPGEESIARSDEEESGAPEKNTVRDWLYWFRSPEVTEMPRYPIYGYE